MLSQRCLRSAISLFFEYKKIRFAKRCYSWQVGRTGSFCRNVTGQSVGSWLIRQYSSKADSALLEFLKTEIESEKKIAEGYSLAAGGDRPSISGFNLAVDQREVVLTKKLGDETVTVIVDVNHSVAAVESSNGGETTRSAQGPEGGGPKMVSRPDFTIRIAKGDRSLVFECAYVEPSVEAGRQEEDYGDLFELDVIYVCAGDDEKSEKYYAVSGEIIDGTLYDHLMTYLEERGIDNAFAQQLSQFSTYYEQKQYVNLLQKMRDFVSQ